MDLNRYLVVGEVDSIFLYNLERFCNWAHDKYFVVVSKEEFYDWCRDKVIPALRDYQESKGKFKSYIHTLVRNEATRVNSKYRRIVKDPEDFARRSETRLAESFYRYGEQISNFEDLARERGLELDRDELLMDLTGDCELPSTKAFLWLSSRGQI